MKHENTEINTTVKNLRKAIIETLSVDRSIVPSQQAYGICGQVIRKLARSETVENIMTAGQVERVAMLPCPFCGGKPIYIKEHADYISCSVCETTGPNASIVGGMNKVIEAWNTRST